MEPVVPIIETRKPSPSPRRGSPADLIACVIASLTAIIAFAYSTLFFSRFLENDTHLWGVISAFLLCFGVGAFGYTPAALTSLIAWKAHKQGATKKSLLWAALLLFPWFVLAVILTFISDMPKLYSVPILMIVTLLIGWALISLRKIKER